MTASADGGSRAQALRNGLALLGPDPAAALEQAGVMVEVDPGDADAHRLAAKALRRLGRAEAAARAELAAIRNSGSVPAIQHALAAIQSGDDTRGESLLRERIAAEPDDAGALYLLAAIALRTGALADAAALLQKALALAPAFIEAKALFATALSEMHDFAGSVQVYRELAEQDPANGEWQSRMAATLARMDWHEQALAAYDALLAAQPGNAMALVGRGHVLKTLGRGEESEASYRTAIALDPACGEAWWSIANLKTKALDADAIETIEAQIAGQPNEKSLVNLLFALGNAKENAGDFKGAFNAYLDGNRRWRRITGYNPDWVRQRSADIVETVTAPAPPPAHVETHMETGGPAPLFIVGMPRAGSTLVEQLLSSHSRIEGTAELPYLPALALETYRGEGTQRPIGQIIAEMSDEERIELGQRYLRKAATHHGTDCRYFIDKTPNNWLFAPLIQAILPDARIIDVRRSPMSCCFSTFKQHFARGQAYSYDLADLGEYYRIYRNTMAHLDRVMPGLVHRIAYDRLISDTADEVTRALEYLGLSFEDDILDFHRNPRAVRTASAQQVRKPIRRKDTEDWVPFSPWLEPLRDALGDLATLETAPD